MGPKGWVFTQWVMANLRASRTTTSMGPTSGRAGQDPEGGLRAAVSHHHRPARPARGVESGWAFRTRRNVASASFAKRLRRPRTGTARKACPPELPSVGGAEQAMLDSCPRRLRQRRGGAGFTRKSAAKCPSFALNCSFQAHRFCAREARSRGSRSPLAHDFPRAFSMEILPGLVLRA